MREKIKNAIRYQLEQGNDEFVIYPYGKSGMLVKEILNHQFGIEEKYIVDNVLCRYNDKIKNVEYLKTDYDKCDFIILLAIEPLSHNTEIVHQQITEFASVERIADVLSFSTYFNPHCYYDEIQTNYDIRWSTLECISREIYLNGISGAIAEAGVYKGSTARYMNALFPDRKLYLFDTFQGFDSNDLKHEDENDICNMKIDFSNTSLDLVMSRMVYPENCIVKAGWFPDSAKEVGDTFCLVRIDMDLYSPTKAGLEYFYARMSRGGYLCVHDCRSKNFDGAKRAVLEFCKENKLNYMCMPDALGTAVICVGY